MAYIEVKAPNMDARIVLAGRDGHRPLKQDFPETTNFIFTEMGYAFHDGAVDSLTNRDFWKKKRIEIHGQESDEDPLDELREYAKERHIPLIAVESAFSSRGDEIVDNEVQGSFTLKLHQALLYFAAVKLRKFDQPGELEQNTFRAWGANHSVGVLEKALPNAVTVRNLLMAQAGTAFLKENPHPGSEKPHATFSVGSAHAGLKRAILMSEEERVAELKRRESSLAETYDLQKLGHRVGVIWLPNSNRWESFGFVDHQLAGVSQKFLGKG